MTTKVALVFRTIGERTSDLALALARENIRPDEVHILDNCRPFTEAVNRMVAIDYDADYVVAVDADSLIYEDMRPFLNANRQAYVDCYVHDRFRNRIHCGVHITRIDVMREMRKVTPPVDDEAYVLRPESRLRKLALNRLGYAKAFKSFRIFHDHHQWLRDVFAKYALRELRSRTVEQRRKLDAALARWSGLDVIELKVAAEAVAWAQDALPEGTTPSELSEVIGRLPEIGAEQVAANGHTERGPLVRAEIDAFAAQHREEWPDWSPRVPVFGLGLSRTGTRSLTAALHVLGVDTVHYPVDPETLESLTSGRLDFPLLEAFDGITDITVSPYYAQLDRLYPDAKFILTIRDVDAWLRSCRNHWTGRDPYAPQQTEEAETHMRIRRFLRAATYGTFEFEEERFRWVYEHHVESVRRYFEGRPGKLLEINLVGGQGWGELCGFLDRRVPHQPFPHKGGVLSRKVNEEVGDPDD